MQKPISAPPTSRQSLAEAAGYGIGTLASVLKEMMPLRLWMTLGLSFIFVLRVFTTDSVLEVVQWTAAYLVVVMLLMGTAVFSKRR